MNKTKVKLVHRSSQADEYSVFRKQTPKESGTWGSCEFTFNPLEHDYDWLVVIDDIPRIMKNGYEKLSCPKEHTIFVTTEPVSVTYYGESFVKQFHYLITNQDEKSLPHPNSIRSQTGNDWFYGKSYDDIIVAEPPQKSKLLSTICSNKRQGHTMHRLRYDFTARMEKEIPELERFGRGFKWIETKAEAIDPYRFHVAVENHIAPHVWTEKLADAFLGYAVPIYHGCPNVYDYFPEDSIICIDITKPDEAIKTIKRAISTPGEYEKRINGVIEARRRVIEEYNLLAMIDKIISNHNDKETLNEISEAHYIYNRRIMRTINPKDLIKFIRWKSNNSIKNIHSRLTI